MSPYRDAPNAGVREVYREVRDDFADLHFEFADPAAFRFWQHGGWAIPSEHPFFLRINTIPRDDARAVIQRVRRDVTSGTLLTLCGETRVRTGSSILIGFLWGLDPTWKPVGAALAEFLPSLQPLPTDWQRLLLE